MSTTIIKEYDTFSSVNIIVNFPWLTQPFRKYLFFNPIRWLCTIRNNMDVIWDIYNRAVSVLILKNKKIWFFANISSSTADNNHIYSQSIRYHIIILFLFTANETSFHYLYSQKNEFRPYYEPSLHLRTCV